MADLVLVHGITESSKTWDPLIASLQEHHRVLAIDLKGHGAATREGPFDIQAMTAHAVGSITDGGFDPTRSVLIGHSLGAMVVSFMASAITPLGVINVDQPLRLGDFQTGLQQLEPLLRGDGAAFRSAIDMVFASMRGPLSEAETARVEAIRSPEQPVVMGVWDTVLTSPAAELNALVDSVVGAVRTPYLALHGIDPGPEYVSWLLGAIRSARCEVWADHGHYPHLVDPTRFVSLVNEFVSAL
jgi:pimeloyl-ACP methyl ester carboxylesterase